MIFYTKPQKIADVQCPVCKAISFYSHDFPGSYIVCQNCGWEDDNIQYNDPDYEGGANELSLNQSIQVYLAKTSLKTKA